MTRWNFDMSTAPRDPKIKILIADPKSKSVCETYWIPVRLSKSGKVLDGDRWSGFSRGREPLAWMPMPEYPNQKSDTGEIAYITLDKGMVAKVDKSDFQNLASSTWYAVERGNTFYAARNVARKTEYMHRVILGITGNERTDHENRDGLDNRRSNLRVSSPSENGANANIRADNTSGYKGVISSGSKWVARIRVSGERLYLGSFNSAEEAAAAYDKAAVEAFGEFACLNSTLMGNARLANAVGVEPSVSGLFLLDDVGSGA